MAIRRPNQRPDPNARSKVVLDGNQTLIDVAQKLHNDPRILPLLRDLNPDVGDKPASGCVIVVPSRKEAQKFAAQMGFSLGFDAAKGGSTKAKRDWKKMRHGAAKSQSSLDPLELAKVLQKQALQPEQLAQRLLTLFAGDADLVLTALRGQDELEEVVSAIALVADRTAALSQLKAIRQLLLGTTQPRGRRRLLLAAEAKPAEVKSLLKTLLVAPALVDDLCQGAQGLASLLEAAEALARLDPVLRAAKIEGQDDAERISQLADAADDKLELVDGPRLALLGVQAQVEPLEKHLQRIASLQSRMLEAVESLAPAQVAAVARGDTDAELEKPWPLAAQLVRAFGQAAMALHPGRRAEGLAALILERPSTECGPASERDVGQPASDLAAPRLSAGELAAAAARNAVIVDEQEDTPERLAPTVAVLFDLLRPLSKFGKNRATTAQQKRSRFKRAVLGGATDAGDLAVTMTVVDELLALATDASDGTLARRAARVTPPVRKRIETVATRLQMPLIIEGNGLTDVARALVVAASVLDPEIGSSLTRASGLEAAVSVLRRQSARVISMAEKIYSMGDQDG